MRKYLLFLVATATVATLAGAAVVSAATGNQDNSEDKGHTQWNAPKPEMLSEVSAKVGFEVANPTVPSGLALQAAEAFSGPGGQGLTYSSTTFARSTSAVGKRGETWIEVLQFDLRLTHAANDATDAVDLGVPGVEAVVWRGPDQDVYTLRSEERTFIVMVTAPAGIGSGGVKGLLTSLAAKP